MKRTTRLLAGTLATLALTAGLATGTAATATATGTDPNAATWTPYAPPEVPAAFPGMYIDFDGDMAEIGTICTLGVVGTDSAGRKVGITAGHCNPQMTQGTTNVETGVWYPNSPKYVGATRGVPISDDNHPVFDRNAVEYAHNNPGGPPVSPIGWIRWVDDDTCDINDKWPDGTPCLVGDDTDPDSRTDYMVIEFAPEVQLSSQVLDKTGSPVMSTASGNKPFKVNSIYANANGAPALPGLLSYVENYGAVSAREPQPALPYPNAVAPGYGMVTEVNNGMIRAAAGFQHGDSGGPVVMRGTGKWVGIITIHTGGLVPWVNTSSKNILNDLNPRNIVGSGITPTDN